MTTAADNILDNSKLRYFIWQLASKSQKNKFKEFSSYEVLKLLESKGVQRKLKIFEKKFEVFKDLSERCLESKSDVSSCHVHSDDILESECELSNLNLDSHNRNRLYKDFNSVHVLKIDTITPRVASPTEIIKRNLQYKGESSTIHIDSLKTDVSDSKLKTQENTRPVNVDLENNGSLILKRCKSFSDTNMLPKDDTLDLLKTSEDSDTRKWTIEHNRKRPIDNMPMHVANFLVDSVESRSLSISMIELKTSSCLVKNTDRSDKCDKRNIVENSSKSRKNDLASTKAFDGSFGSYHKSPNTTAESVGILVVRFMHELLDNVDLFEESIFIYLNKLDHGSVFHKYKSRFKTRNFTTQISASMPPIHPKSPFPSSTLSDSFLQKQDVGSNLENNVKNIESILSLNTNKNKFDGVYSFLDNQSLKPFLDRNLESEDIKNPLSVTLNRDVAIEDCIRYLTSMNPSLRSMNCLAAATVQTAMVENNFKIRILTKSSDKVSSISLMKGDRVYLLNRELKKILSFEKHFSCQFKSSVNWTNSQTKSQTTDFDEFLLKETSIRTHHTVANKLVQANSRICTTRQFCKPVCPKTLLKADISQVEEHQNSPLKYSSQPNSKVIPKINHKDYPRVSRPLGYKLISSDSLSFRTEDYGTKSAPNLNTPIREDKVEEIRDLLEPKNARSGRAVDSQRHADAVPVDDNSTKRLIETTEIVTNSEFDENLVDDSSTFSVKSADLSAKHTNSEVLLESDFDEYTLTSNSVTEVTRNYLEGPPLENFLSYLNIDKFCTQEFKSTDSKSDQYQQHSKLSFNSAHHRSISPVSQLRASLKTKNLSQNTNFQPGDDSECSVTSTDATEEWESVWSSTTKGHPEMVQNRAQKTATCSQTEIIVTSPFGMASGESQNTELEEVFVEYLENHNDGELQLVSPENEPSDETNSISYKTCSGHSCKESLKISIDSKHAQPDNVSVSAMRSGVLEMAGQIERELSQVQTKSDSENQDKTAQDKQQQTLYEQHTILARNSLQNRSPDDHHNPMLFHKKESTEESSVGNISEVMQEQIVNSGQNKDTDQCNKVGLLHDTISMATTCDFTISAKEPKNAFHDAYPQLLASKIQRFHELSLELTNSLDRLYNDIDNTDAVTNVMDILQSLCSEFWNVIIEIPKHFYAGQLEKHKIQMTIIFLDMRRNSTNLYFRLHELVDHLRKAGDILSVKFLPADLAKTVYAIQVRYEHHVASTQRQQVHLQYVYVPALDEKRLSMFASNREDRRVWRLENVCCCRSYLLAPSHPEAQLAPPGHVTLEVIYDSVRGRPRGFISGLDRLLCAGSGDGHKIRMGPLVRCRPDGKMERWRTSAGFNLFTGESTVAREAYPLDTERRRSTNQAGKRPHLSPSRGRGRGVSLLTAPRVPAVCQDTGYALVNVSEPSHFLDQNSPPLFVDGTRRVN